jgi:transposase
MGGIKMAKKYKEEFKKQIVRLFNNGKSLADLNREYGIAKSTISTWIERYNGTGSFNISDNRTEEENELIKLRKKIKLLEMENDILKQAALILGKK